MGGGAAFIHLLSVYLLESVYLVVQNLNTSQCFGITVTQTEIFKENNTTLLAPFSLPVGIVTATTVPWSANTTTQPAIKPQAIQAALSTTAAVAAAAAAATTSSSSSLSSTTASLLSSILPTIDSNPLDVLAGTASAATSFLDSECRWPRSVHISCLSFFYVH